MDNVAYGALIETDKKFFLVGVSSPAIHVHDKELICFSTEAPIFHALEGKKKGDTFKLGNDTHTIKNVQ